MVIKLKSKLKHYLTNIWMMEIILLLLLGFYILSDINSGTDNIKSSNILTAFQVKSNPKEVFKKEFENDRDICFSWLAENVFKIDNSLLGNNYKGNIYFETNVYTTHKFYYILINKNNNSVITNDLQYYNLVQNDIDKSINIQNYISEKYNGQDISSSYDNNKIYNPIGDKYISIDKNKLYNYEEYYYTSILEYSSNFDNGVVYLAYSILILTAVLLLKLIVAFIYHKGRVKIKGNFIKTAIYIFKNGFKYPSSRVTLIFTIIMTLSAVFVYLYFLAVDRYDSNMLVKFFSRYPFKSVMLLMLLPIICIMYSTKKIIDINCVNSNLKEINDGNVNKDISNEGSKEIIELVRNIEKIKDGYQIAIEEKIKNEKDKTELITNVSHDLRTPLTSIINYVNILSDNSLSEEERSEYLKILDVKSKKLKVLIDDLFEMSKLNSGKITINRQEIDVISLIHQVIGEYSYIYEDKKVDFMVESSSEEIYISLDGRLMSRVIENIIINAIKYSMDNTRIYVDVQEKEKSIVIAVKNVANYEMSFNNNEIFERFVRGDVSRNSNIEGSGLGLAITKSIVELHEGKVKIEREGDMFKIYIYLPK